MAMTKRELIQFMDELVELASEENKTRAILVKEKFISDFEKSYEYEKEVQTEVSYLPPYYIAAMPDDVQEEIKQKAGAITASIRYRRISILETAKSSSMETDSCSVFRVPVSPSSARWKWEMSFWERMTRLSLSIR